MASLAISEGRDGRPPGIAGALLCVALACAACNGDRSATTDPMRELGREVFTELAIPSCATCHTLSDAGASGRVGPDLDQLKPERERVVAAVSNGVGIMPSQGQQLTREQIEAVSYYVAEVTRR